MFEESEGQTGIWRYLNLHNVGLVVFVTVFVLVVDYFDGGEDIDGNVRWSSTGGDLWSGEPNGCQDANDYVMFKWMGDDERVHLTIREDSVHLHGSMDYTWEPSQCTIEVFSPDTGNRDGVARGACAADDFRISWDVEYEYCGEEGGGV